MDEAEAALNIVAKTADTMELAEQVLLERRKRDGQEYSSEKPSLLEVVTVSNLIVNMGATGMYKDKKPDDWVPPPGVINAFLKQVEPLIESKVSIAMSKARMAALGRPTTMVPPITPPPPPPDERPES